VVLALATNIHFNSLLCFIDIEKSCISDSVLQFVLRSNLTMNRRVIKQLVPFRFVRVFKPLGRYFRMTSIKNKFLWLNSKVKYKRQPLYYAPFFNAGIFFIISYLIAIIIICVLTILCFKFNLEPDQELFHNYIKLYLAIPETWKSTGMISNNHMVNVLSELKCNSKSI